MAGGLAQQADIGQHGLQIAVVEHQRRYADALQRLHQGCRLPGRGHDHQISLQAGDGLHGKPQTSANFGPFGNVGGVTGKRLDADNGIAGADGRQHLDVTGEDGDDPFGRVRQYDLAAQGIDHRPREAVIGPGYKAR